MKKCTFFLWFILLCPIIGVAQLVAPPVTTTSEMVFLADTQQPMWVETILLKRNNNKTATAGIFAEILRRKPGSLYMLGDVVALGYSNKQWKNVDLFLDSCRKLGTHVSGILGNHEIMGRRKKGERNFDKRFPLNVRTGYFSVTDSVAVILLNSNFRSLSVTEKERQKNWYEAMLESLDETDSIKAVIVTCHHAPYSNSKVVKGSNSVQEYFIPAYLKSKKAQLFITGHAHAFERFSYKGKDFIVIGGGGGLHQPLNKSASGIPDLANDYKPMFHYLSVQRFDDKLLVTSHYLKENFLSFEVGHTFQTKSHSENLATAPTEAETESKIN